MTNLLPGLEALSQAAAINALPDDQRAIYMSARRDGLDHESALLEASVHPGVA